MQIKLFFIGLADFEQGNEELNKFLRSKKVVNIVAFMDLKAKSLKGIFTNYFQKLFFCSKKMRIFVGEFRK